MTARQRAELHAAIDRGWLRYRCSRSPALFDAFYEFCVQAEQPLIWVRLRQRYAAVGFDLWPMRRLLTHRGEELARRLIVEFAVLDREGWAAFGRERSEASKVPLELADELARLLYALVLHPDNFIAYQRSEDTH